MMFSRIVFMLLSVSSSMASANIGSYVGYWSVNCGGFGGNIIVSDGGGVRINVNDNNLLISAKLKELKSGSSELFFVDVLESRNEKINWSSISLEKPIAKLSVNGKFLVVNWYGFFDKKKRLYIWNKQPDFILENNGDETAMMKKCIFD